MPSERPKIPARTKRAVSVEAGSRCAIPTCRQTSGLEIHHIEPWAKVKEHAFENLILLCAVCHSRATKGEIDRTTMKAYKANLGLMNQRYGDLERRVLEKFVQAPEDDEIVIDRSHRLLLEYLVTDGLLVERGPATGAVVFTTEGQTAEDAEGQYFGPTTWGLTEVGKATVERLRSAASLS